MLNEKVYTRRDVLLNSGRAGLAYLSFPLSIFSKNNEKNSSRASKKFSLSTYLKWINKTIEESQRTGDLALIVDKEEYTLRIISEGKVVRKYNIELGRNPLDDKTKEGDGCTPEGLYRVSKKRGIGQTSYYKSLLINYPNQGDWQEFRKLREEGKVLECDRIGGAIEVHGYGSGMKGNNGGNNWTAGCIALSNSDMDNIFELTKENTPITIVGFGGIILG